MAVNAGDEDIGGLGDGLQAGLQLRQGLVFGPSGDVAQAVGAGLDAVILADGIGNAFRLHFLCVFIFRFGRFPICNPSGGGELLPLTVVEHSVGDLMDGGAHCLHLAHALPDGDSLIVQAQKPVQALPQRLEHDRHRGRAPQGLHERLVLLHIPGQAGNKAGEGTALGLAHIEHLDRAKQGNLDFPFLHDNIPVMVQYRRSGVRVQLHFLNALFERRGGDNGQALLALFHMTAKLIFPLIESSHMGGAGHLHMDEDGIIIGITVKPGHGAEIVRKFVALKQVLYVCLNPGDDFLDSFPIAGLFVCHGKNLLS